MPRKPTNPLEAHFRANKGRLIQKWTHYFEIYDRHFASYRGKEITVVEFGVSHGGSVKMWKKYFGKKARIVGIDIFPDCATLAEKQIEIHIGDQEDRTFLRDLVKKIGPIDVLIEDGGHHMQQQIATFEEMWPSITEGGVYLCEDLHTSYWPEYGGAYKAPGTFIEYSKNLVDQMNAWHAKPESGLAVDDYTRSIKGMHVYDSIVVLDKGTVAKPSAVVTGTPTFPS